MISHSVIFFAEKSSSRDLAGRHQSYILLHRQHLCGTKEDPEVPEPGDPLSGVGQPRLHHPPHGGVRLQGQGQHPRVIGHGTFQKQQSVSTCFNKESRRYLIYCLNDGLFIVAIIDLHCSVNKF